MYTIYIKNQGMMKKIVPYKLQGIYTSAVKAYNAISKLDINQNDILIKCNDETIDYIELVEAANNNTREQTEIEKLNKDLSYILFHDDHIDKFLKETDNLTINTNNESKEYIYYKLMDYNSGNTIMLFKIDDVDSIVFLLKDPEKFSYLMDNKEIFKFEFFSLKSIRKTINTETLSKDEIYKTLTSIFEKSIEESLIIISEDV